MKKSNYFIFYKKGRENISEEEVFKLKLHDKNVLEILIMPMVSRESRYVKTHQIIHFKCVVYFMSIIAQQNCLEKV